MSIVVTGATSQLGRAASGRSARSGRIRLRLPQARLGATDQQRHRHDTDGQPTSSLGHRRRSAIPPPPVWDPPTGNWGLTVRWIAATRVLATSSICW